MLRAIVCADNRGVAIGAFEHPELRRLVGHRMNDSRLVFKRKLKSDFRRIQHGTKQDRYCAALAVEKHAESADNVVRDHAFLNGS
ncbi:MAG TPA: hypothetical protein VN541_04595 [Tepidisphaeraceae bacterium]|nr:hypothetical protein [Tepidisphaeraceae bacterium]